MVRRPVLQNKLYNFYYFLFIKNLLYVYGIVIITLC
jgi:hypothetical protein